MMIPVIIENILDLIDNSGEADIQEDLSEFSSPMNPEIERFIRTKAIEFARKKLSVTYLVTDVSDGQLLGYFTLTHKAIEIDNTGLSKTLERKLSRYARLDVDTNSFSVSAFLIAQFGKNYSVDDGTRLRGVDLMDLALDVLVDIQRRIGGGVVYLDAEDRPALKSFYENGVSFKLFDKRFSERDDITYLQYMKLI